MNASAYQQDCPNYINGAFVKSTAPYPNHSPVDNRLIGQVYSADRALVDQAVTSAQQAQQGEWPKLHVSERAALLRKVADRIDSRFDDFVAAEIADTGKPYQQASTLDVPRASINFRTFANLAETEAGESFLTPTPDRAGALNYSLRRPLGVVGVIAPWNLPLLLLSWKLAPALICGNSVVAKPSEVTPSTATLLAEVFDEVGLPAGVFNLIHGFGPNAAGEFLVSHPGVDGITFTGESSTGRRIMQQAAVGVREISFELGGKNAALVFADADFDQVVAGIARSTFTNCGQVCLCTERVYVEASIFDRFVEALKTQAEQLTLGDPYADGTTTGPLISHEHRDKVLSYYQLAQQEGAQLITGGGIPQLAESLQSGCWVQPTIFTGLADDSRTQREEIFGPVCHISPFKDEAEAIKRANDSNYGLASAVWTQNLSRAHRVAAAMASGITWVNCWYLRDLRTPFGGNKLSGIGREGGRHSLDFYSHPNNICIKL